MSREPSYARVVKGRLVLPRQTRRRFFAGELPGIVLRGGAPCPIEPGAVYELSPRMRLEVTKVVRDKRMDWSLRYTLHDRRDNPRLLRRNPHAVDFESIRASYDEYGMPGEPTRTVIEEAREGSAYTSTPIFALGEVGEAVDDEFLRRDRLARDVDLANEKKARANRERAKARAAEGRLAATRQRAGSGEDGDGSSGGRAAARRSERAEKRLRKATEE
jgi:hypothetical protein